MSGKPGQRGTGSAEIAERYSANFMDELDGGYLAQPGRCERDYVHSWPIWVEKLS